MLISQWLLKYYYSIITGYIIFLSCENFLYFPGAYTLLTFLNSALHGWLPG